MSVTVRFCHGCGAVFLSSQTRGRCPRGCLAPSSMRVISDGTPPEAFSQIAVPPAPASQEPSIEAGSREPLDIGADANAGLTRQGRTSIKVCSCGYAWSEYENRIQTQRCPRCQSLTNLVIPATDNLDSSYRMRCAGCGVMLFPFAVSGNCECWTCHADRWIVLKRNFSDDSTWTPTAPASPATNTPPEIIDSALATTTTENEATSRPEHVAPLSLPSNLPQPDEHGDLLPADWTQECWQFAMLVAETIATIKAITYDRNDRMQVSIPLESYLQYVTDMMAEMSSLKHKSLVPAFERMCDLASRMDSILRLAANHTVGDFLERARQQVSSDITTHDNAWINTFNQNKLLIKCYFNMATARLFDGIPSSRDNLTDNPTEKNEEKSDLINVLEMACQKMASLADSISTGPTPNTSTFSLEKAFGKYATKRVWRQFQNLKKWGEFNPKDATIPSKPCWLCGREIMPLENRLCQHCMENIEAISESHSNTLVTASTQSKSSVCRGCGDSRGTQWHVRSECASDPAFTICSACGARTDFRPDLMYVQCEECSSIRLATEEWDWVCRNQTENGLCNGTLFRASTWAGFHYGHTIKCQRCGFKCDRPQLDNEPTQDMEEEGLNVCPKCGDPDSMILLKGAFLLRNGEPLRKDRTCKTCGWIGYESETKKQNQESNEMPPSPACPRCNSRDIEEKHSTEDLSAQEKCPRCGWTGRRFQLMGTCPTDTLCPECQQDIRKTAETTSDQDDNVHKHQVCPQCGWEGNENTSGCCPECGCANVADSDSLSDNGEMPGPLGLAMSADDMRHAMSEVARALRTISTMCPHVPANKNLATHQKIDMSCVGDVARVALLKLRAETGHHPQKENTTSNRNSDKSKQTPNAPDTPDQKETLLRTIATYKQAIGRIQAEKERTLAKAKKMTDMVEQIELLHSEMKTTLPLLQRYIELYGKIDDQVTRSVQTAITSLNKIRKIKRIDMGDDDSLLA